MTLQRAIWIFIGCAVLAVRSALPDDLPPGRRVALLVGINTYQKPFFDNLKYAERDVEQVAAELKKLGFAATTLTGKAATREAIDRYAVKMVRPLTRDDVMLVMLCGHGLQLDVKLPDGSTRNDAFFCPYDAVANDPATLFSLSRLIDEILAPNVGRKLVLVDACRNDPDASRSSRGIEGKVIALPEDTAVMFSCRKGQKSFENDELRHGLFTYCVLEGLRGEAVHEGVIGWGDLQAFVNRRMASEDFRTKYLPRGGARQEPIPAGGVPYTVLGRLETLNPASPSGPPPSSLPPDRERRPPSPARLARPAQTDAIYALRFRRGDAAHEHGGTPESEVAVEKALNWLVSVQQPDGQWIENLESGDAQAGDSDTGITGLALLAFLGAGATTDVGGYVPAVDRGVKWLISQQGADGSLAGGTTGANAVYCHAIAATALAEALAFRQQHLSDDPLRTAVERAVAYIADAQLQDGGWRYTKSVPAGDMCVTAWQVTALRAAELAGLTIPLTTREGVIRFLQGSETGTSGGLAAYQKGGPTTPTMTAAALHARQSLGLDQDDARRAEAVNFLLKSPPTASSFDEYNLYYTSLALRHEGGDSWQGWNERFRGILLAHQKQNGEFDNGGRWSQSRVYATAMAVLSLEVYYRFNPPAVDGLRLHGRLAPKQHNWYVNFDRVDSAESEFATSLDYFGVELAAVSDDDRRATILASLTAPQPRIRTLALPLDAPLYSDFLPENTNVHRFATAILRREGVDTKSSRIVLVFPEHVQPHLVRAEQQLAGDQPLPAGRPVIFSIRREGQGYGIDVSADP